MRSSMGIKNLEKKIKDWNNDLLLYDQQWVIVPYMPSGYHDYSNRGLIDYQTNYDAFETYKRYWTGDDSFIITWKDSIKFSEDYDFYDEEHEYVNSIALDWQVGEAFLGWMEDSSSENEISKDINFSEYVSQKQQNRVVFRIAASQVELTENYKYYFYKIPELSDQHLFKVDSLERQYLGRDLMCYVLTLSSLNDELSSTGRAKLLNVMPSAPGQGYLNPKITEATAEEIEVLKKNQEEGKDFIVLADNKRVVSADKTNQRNNPVTDVIVRLYGMGVLSNFTMVGRRAYLGDTFTDFGTQRLLFIKDFVKPQKDNYLYRTQTTEQNFYWCNQLRPYLEFTSTIENSLKSWYGGGINYWEPEGLVRDISESYTKKTNPETNDVYSFSLFGGGSVNLGETTLPDAGDYWEFSRPSYSFSNLGSYGVDSTYTWKDQETSLSGSGNVCYIHDAMFDAYWCQKEMATLPITGKGTLTFGSFIGYATSALSIGGLTGLISGAALFLLGIILSSTQKIKKQQYKGFAGIIPCSLYDFITQESQATLSTSSEYFRLSYFDSTKNTGEIDRFFNTQTMSLQFQATITDMIKDSGGNRFCTTEIAQTENANGEKLLSSGDPLLMDGSYRLDNRITSSEEEDYGFIIDSFNLQAIFNGDFSVEFLDSNGDVVWYGVFQSQAKWTGSIREINTWRNTSIFGREITYNGKPLYWPKALASYAVSDVNLNLTDISLEYSTNNFALGSYTNLSGNKYLTYNSSSKLWEIPFSWNNLKTQTITLATNWDSIELFWQYYGDITIKLYGGFYNTDSGKPSMTTYGEETTITLNSTTPSVTKTYSGLYEKWNKTLYKYGYSSSKTQPSRITTQVTSSTTTSNNSTTLSNKLYSGAYYSSSEEATTKYQVTYTSGGATTTDYIYLYQTTNTYDANCISPKGGMLLKVVINVYWQNNNIYISFNPTYSEAAFFVNDFGTSGTYYATFSNKEVGGGSTIVSTTYKYGSATIGTVKDSDIVTASTYLGGGFSVASITCKLK